MAQFDYFGTWNDSWAILQDIFACGDIRAFWDAGPHEKAHAEPFTALTPELKDHLRSRPGLYLFGSYSTHPPLFWQQDMGPDAGKYFLSDSGGGPLISLSLARELPLDKLTLAAGMLCTQPHYELEPGQWHKPTEALRAAYADLQKRMKGRLVRYRQALWVGPEALQLLEEGRAQLPATLHERFKTARPTPARKSSASTPPAPPVPKAAQQA